MKMRLYPLLLLLIISGALSAQPLPDSTITKIDKIFKEWDNTRGPGCAVGIIRNDSLIFARGYGLANIEYDVPIKQETIFHMASISKQFTAYSIVLLAKQGKLKLDDEVRKYLPWFPKFNYPITIRQLLNHTSGVRDQWQLLSTAGTRLDDVITQDQIIKILSNQRDLNFKPGDEYNYSNSGFTLLSEIVHSVTGQTLRHFTDSAIFRPLGMMNTHFHDDYTEVVKNRSYSYWAGKDKAFNNAVLSYAVSGATSLFTNIDDMSKWVMNFYAPKVGDASTIQELTRKAKLNSGKEISYAEGIINDTYKGWQQFSHSGADAGYRTNITVLPGAKMGFLVFCNLGNMDVVGLTHKLMDLIVTDSAGIKKEVAKEDDKDDETVGVLKDVAAAKKFEGRYIAPVGFTMQLTVKDNKLYVYSGAGDTDILVKRDKDTFSVAGVAGFFFVLNGAASKASLITPDGLFPLEKYVDNPNPPDTALQAYVGKYYCPELDCSYGIKLKDHKLYLTNAKYDDVPLTLTGTEHFNCEHWWMDHMVITRNSTKKITGFEVNSGRVMHLKFNKVE